MRVSRDGNRVLTTFWPQRDDHSWFWLFTVVRWLTTQKLFLHTENSKNWELLFRKQDSKKQLFFAGFSWKVLDQHKKRKESRTWKKKEKTDRILMKTRITWMRILYRLKLEWCYNSAWRRLLPESWGISAVGSASHWQCGGHGFKSRMLHSRISCWNLKEKRQARRDFLRAWRFMVFLIPKLTFVRFGTAFGVIIL